MDNFQQTDYQLHWSDPTINPELELGGHNYTQPGGTNFSSAVTTAEKQHENLHENQHENQYENQLADQHGADFLTSNNL